MTKKISTGELVKRISRRTGIWPAFVREVIDVLLNEMCRELAQEHQVELYRFGTFRPRVMTPPPLYVPSVGEWRQPKAAIRVEFRRGIGLREYLAGSICQ